jgi:hypothetical protein
MLFPIDDVVPSIDSALERSLRMSSLVRPVRLILVSLLWLMTALQMGCAIKPQPPLIINLAGTPLAKSDVPQIAKVTVGGDDSLAIPVEALAPTSTGTPTTPPTPTQTPTSTPTETSTSTETPTLLLVPLAKLTLPPKSPTPTVTPPVLPSALKGKIAFKSDRLGYQNIFVMNPDGSDVALLTDNWAYQTALDRDARSPDDTRVAFVRQVDSPYSAMQLFYYDSIWKKEIQVTQVTKGGAAWDPAWSPGGDKIAFTSNFMHGDNVFMINIDGSDLVRLAVNPNEWDHHPSWSPDGSRIVFMSNRSGVEQIWTMNPDGTDLKNISPWSDWNDWDPVWIKW